jgi:hypothetical protein
LRKGEFYGGLRLKGSRMKENPFFLLSMIFLLLFPGLVWAQCSEDSNDLGICDTLYVEAWPHTDTCFIGCNSPEECDTICINNPGEFFPCFLYVSLFVTHDSNTFYSESQQTWVQDSITGFVVPLAFWCPPGGCLDSVVLPDWDDWNNTTCGPYMPTMPRSIFRDVVNPITGDTVHNRMLDLAKEDPNTVWTMVVLNPKSCSCDQDSGHAWLTMMPAGPSCRRWWEGKRAFLATFTFMVYTSQGCDTAEICFDSILWPPQSHLAFVRHDATKYVPRTNLLKCVRIAGGSTGVRWIEGSAEEENVPTSFSVSQNYPNPFNPATRFRFDLPRASHVQIEVFNILGQRVKTLVDERRKAGSHVVNWDGKDERGLEVSSGIYFYRMTADDFSDIKKMLLLK